MFEYILRRTLLMIPTLFGITVVVFVIVNLAPGGPIEQKIKQLQAGDTGAASANSNVAGGVSAEVIEALRIQYGFDKPLMTRYWIWLKNIFRMDFGESFSYEEPVSDIIVSKFPVSIQFGLVSFILTYIVCIPLGILKALRAGTVFDFVSTVILFILYSIPSLMLAILLLVFFAGGSYLDWYFITRGRLLHQISEVKLKKQSPKNIHDAHIALRFDLKCRHLLSVSSFFIKRSII